jgi:hypothetical protein
VKLRFNWRTSDKIQVLAVSHQKNRVLLTSKIFTHSRSGLFLFNTEVIVGWNDTAKAIFGYKCAAKEPIVTNKRGKSTKSRRPAVTNLHKIRTETAITPKT